MSRSTSWVRALVLFVVFAGCSSGHEDIDGTASGLASLDLHTIEQEAIQQCMIGQGFEYSPAVHYESLILGTGSPVEFVLAERQGYGGLRDGALAYLPRGQSLDPELSQAGAEQYALALLGATDIESMEPGHSGCLGVGRRARIEASPAAVAPLDAATRFVAVLESSQYAEFSDAWRNCMLAKGIEGAGPSPFEFQRRERQGFAAEAQRVIETDGAAGPVRRAIEAVADDGSIDADDLDQIASASLALRQILDREIRAALVDQGCVEAALADTGVSF